MDINASIPDEQGAALAQYLNVTNYTDANDLISRVAAAAYLRLQKQALIGAIATETDAASLATVVNTYGPVASSPVKMPVLKASGDLKPGLVEQP